jgi:hypothetical protein
LTVDIIRQQTTFFKFVKQDFSNKYKILLFSLLIIDWTINIIRL